VTDRGCVPFSSPSPTDESPITTAAATGAPRRWWPSIRRGPTLAGSVAGSTLAFTDSGLVPQTTYLYRVIARDAAGNQSDPSNDAIVTTDPAPTSGTFTFDVAADSYVDESAAAVNYGTATSLRIDASPQQISYLRFDLSGVVGTVSSVTLRLYAQANGNKGCNVLPVADSSWDETALTWNNAPARGASVATCDSFNANTWVVVDLTAAALVSGNGQLSLAISNPSSTSTRFSSREGPNPAQLVVVTVPPDTEKPTPPANLVAGAAAAIYDRGRDALRSGIEMLESVAERGLGRALGAVDRVERIGQRIAGRAGARGREAASELRQRGRGAIDGASERGREAVGEIRRRGGAAARRAQGTARRTASELRKAGRAATRGHAGGPRPTVH